MLLGQKTLTTWATWLSLRRRLSTDAQKARSQDLSHSWTSQLISRWSPLLSYPTKLTGAQKELFQLLKTKATAVHVGPSPLLPSLSRTLPSQLDFSSICRPNKSLHALPTPISVEAKVIAMGQLLKLLLTTLPKARASLRNSNTHIPHTMALKAPARYQLLKLQKFKSQALSSLLKITILSCWMLLLNLAQLLSLLTLALGTLTMVVSTMAATRLPQTLTTLLF